MVMNTKKYKIVFLSIVIFTRYADNIIELTILPVTRYKI